MMKPPFKAFDGAINVIHAPWFDRCTVWFVASLSYIIEVMKYSCHLCNIRLIYSHLALRPVAFGLGDYKPDIATRCIHICIYIYINIYIYNIYICDWSSKKGTITIFFQKFFFCQYILHLSLLLHKQIQSMLTFLNDIIKRYKIGYQFRSLGQELLPFLVLVCPSSWQWLQVRFLF